MVVVPLKEYPVATARQIQPGVSPSEVAQPYAELSKTLSQFGEAAETTASSLAEQAGAQAVTRDANGDIQVQKAAFIGPAAAHYERAVKVAALTEADGAAQRKDTELRTDFHNDPQGYLKAADQYAKDMQISLTRTAGPEVGNGVRRVIERTTTQTYRGLLGEKERLDLQRADTSIVTGIQSARDDLVALARGGVTSGPDWDAALDKVKTLTAERVANPRLAYPQDKADFDLQTLEGDLSANAFLHRIDQTYKSAPTKAEGAKTALDQAQSILTDRSIKLSEQQREAYYHKAVGEIRANEAIRKQDIGEARLASQQLVMASSMGAKVNPEDVEGVAQLHVQAGDQAGAARLYAHFARAPLGDDYGRQPLPAMTQQLNAVRGQAAAKSAYDFFVGRGYTPAQASGIVGNLIHESGLDPGAVGDQGTSIGVAQFHAERAAALAKYAKETGRDVHDLQTQFEFIDKELQSTEAATLQRLKTASTPEEAAAAFVHYERPRGYTPENPAGALGFQSRIAQAKAVFGGQGNITVNTPASAMWLQANRARTLDTAARAQWKELWTDYEKEGIRPPDKKVNDLLDAARAVGDHDLLETIAAAGDRLALAQRQAEQPLPAQEAQIAELHRQGAEGMLQAGQQGVLKDLERRYTAIQTGLKDNPIATTVANFGTRFKTPAPLNLQDPNKLAAGLAYRGKIAQFAAQNWQTGPVPALDKADMAAVSGALDTPDPKVKAAIFQAITQALPEDVRNATLAKLGEKGPEQMVSAAAGGLMPSAPDIAASILRGQAARKADKAYLPEKAEGQKFTEDFAKMLPASTFTLAGRTDPAGPMAIARGAIEARYADLSAQAGDTSGTHNKDRLQQAVTDVTGGVLDHNGGSLIAPARGMTQGQFDGLLYGLTDRDMAGVSTLAGEPISADYLRGNAQLESVGDGRYFVRLGRDPMRPIYAYQGANTEMPQKFVLDLRGRTGRPVPFVDPNTLQSASSP